jgi:hypothetical protein
MLVSIAIISGASAAAGYGAASLPPRPATASPVGVASTPTAPVPAPPAVAAEQRASPAERSQGPRPTSPATRMITAAPIGLVGAPGASTAPIGDGLMVEVPLYVHDAEEVRAVEVRCNVFAQGRGDLIGSGTTNRPVSGGSLAETVAVPITLRAGKTRAQPARYACAASFVIGNQQADRAPPGARGTAAMPERRAAAERANGRAFATFTDRAEGEIAPR